MTTAQESDIAIQTIGVERVFCSGSNAVKALKGVDLCVPTAHIVALKGRSGSGKTTLLNCLGGLDQASAGEILIHQRAVQQFSDNERTEWRRKEVGFVFQAFGLLPTLSALENVELMLRIAGFGRKSRTKQALAALELVDLAKWKDHRPFEMSGGQNQRVAIARAIVTRPKIILADEPTGELDSETTHQIMALLRRLAHDETVTILLATHDELVDQYVDTVIELVDGRIKTNSAETQPVTT